MKKQLSFLVILNCILFLNFLNLQAQDYPSVGLAPKIAEQRIIKAPYSPLILPDILASTAYADDAYATQWCTIAIPAGTITNIASLSGIYYGGDFANGIYYATTYNPSNLYTINLATGVPTLVGPLTGTTGYVPTSLAYKQSSGPMYLGAPNSSLTSANLYTVNLTTGACSLVGPITNANALIFMAINCIGDCYGVDITSDNTVKINLTTGAGTIVGPCGINANYAQGGSFELSSNILYWASYSTSAELRTINLTTGASTLIASFAGNHELVAFGMQGDCGGPPPNPCNIQAGPFLSLPQLIIPLTAYPIKAKITNVGAAAQTNIPVKFFVNGTQYGSTLYIPSLSPGASDSSAVFAWSPTASGPTTIAIATSLACDTVRNNDTVKTTVSVGCASVFTDDFSGGDGNWNIVNNGGTCLWSVKPRTSRPYQMPPTAVGNVFSADVDQCGPSTTINSTATMINSINCYNKYNIYLEFDSDFYLLGQDVCKVDASYDGGTSWNNILNWTTNRRNTHEVVLMPGAANQTAVKVRFTSIQPAWDWWWAVDNVTIHACNLVGTPKEKEPVPVTYMLSQNYPNPFNPTTVISYALPKAGNVKLVVYDLLGREVKTLVNEFKTAGNYNVTFDGSSFASGLYIYRITSGSFTDVKKMILVK
jgi:hypothetical protein